MREDISARDLKILFMSSGGYCAIPECRRKLLVDETGNDDESIIAQMAHISGKKPGAPRYDKSMTDEDRNSHTNLILVCNNCHKVIDDQPNTYTVEKLHEIKDAHKRWIQESIKNEVINVTFEELDAVTKHLVYSPAITTDSYELIPPKEKISKNELSTNAEQMIRMGLVRAKEVERFISDSPENHFGDQLKQRFVTEYDRLRNEGFKRRLFV